MSIGLLGKKLGMTQIFDKDGKQTPVTVLKVESTYVTQKKQTESDGYRAVQLATAPKKRFTKPEEGHFKKSKQKPMRFVREIRSDQLDTVEVGDVISLNCFEVGDFVNVQGRSIGKGFQGVVKRHGYSGGPGGHGSKFHKEPGGIGARAGGKGCAKKVTKGKPLPGRMGGTIITVQNLEVMEIDSENQLLALKGNVPGGGNNYILIQNSYKKTPTKEWKVEGKGESEEPKEEENAEEAPQKKVAETPEEKAEEAPQKKVAETPEEKPEKVKEKAETKEAVKKPKAENKEKTREKSEKKPEKKEKKD